MSHSLHDLPDEELVALSRKELPHGTPAFEELIRRYEPLVFGSCLRVLGNAQDAEEATQDVFLRLARKLALFHGQSKFKTWFYRLAHNVAFDVRRRIMKRINRERELLDNLQESTPEPVTRGHGGLVFDVLETMDEPQREILMLRFASDLEFSQIADTLELSLSAAKMRVYRALEEFEVLFRAAQSSRKTATDQSSENDSQPA